MGFKLTTVVVIGTDCTGKFNSIPYYIRNTILGNSTISVESRCYLPEKKSGSVNDLTETYVQQYTWNIFCLYTDIIEKILKQCNIVYLVSGEIPKGLGNCIFALLSHHTFNV
jgi:hypothetical protein